jgi:kynurenine formamidase
MALSSAGCVVTKRSGAHERVDLVIGESFMNFIDLTMPLTHQWMPDEVLPTSVKFFLGPKNHQEKGIVVGSETGTCLMLPSAFTDFRKTTRIDELPIDKLVLRPTTVAAIAKSDGEEITQADVEKALDSCRPANGDALLIRTGWGDRSYDKHNYVLQSPHFSLEAAKYLGARMRENDSDLLLIDTAIVGWPAKHLIPEWCTMTPTPPVESAEARMYLHLYDADKVKADFAVEMEFARLGITTVRKLIHCGEIKKPKVKIIVAPLQIVRGVASTCRVVAVED